MTRVKTESIYEETTPKEDIDTPIAKAFNKVESYSTPLLSNELMRKRRKVKQIVDD